MLRLIPLLALLGSIVFAAPADARCWWNGYYKVCEHGEGDYWRHRHHHDEDRYYR
jgi:hypothetical protein